jgi:ferrochelatase
MTRYTDEPTGVKDYPSRVGVLITNLGTPDAPTPPALKRYLAEFLSDPRVIERPRLLWWLILHGVILRIRPRRAALAYQEVWTENGSPLMAISRRQEGALKKLLYERFGDKVQVALAMRYGNPSIETGLRALRTANAQQLLVLPLYPQYSATTTASTFDAVADVLRTWRRMPELRMINDYHDDSGYIEALAGRIREHWKKHGQAERLLFSFHGLPKRYATAGDPYPDQCQRTAALVAQALELPQSRWHLSFQSRFGPEEWLKPYTDHTLQSWGREGVKSVDVVSPGFSADCLETLEEIAIQNREFFLKAGGETYRYIPALNDGADHMQVLADLVARHCQGWL